MNDVIRPGETTIDLPAAYDASVYFIGHIRTPFVERSQCPRQGDRENGPECRIEIDPRWRQALLGIERYSELQILYWMNFSRRDLVLQVARSRGEAPDHVIDSHKLERDLLLSLACRTWASIHPIFGKPRSGKQASTFSHPALGTFALRSPARPNPIASSIVSLLRVEAHVLFVKGLDCLDTTPLIDVKPNYETAR